MSLVKMKDKGQVTIPANIRLAVSAQVGDLFEVEVANGNIILKPQEIVARGAAASKGVDIGKWIGAGKGLFSSVDEADAFIKAERAAWE